SRAAHHTHARLDCTNHPGAMIPAQDHLLTGRAVLVTGGSSGIGRAIALAAAAAGADVAVTYRANEGGAEDTVRDIQSSGRRSAAIQMDLTRGESIPEPGAAAIDALGGRLDVWINNAGADILTQNGAALSPVE